MKKDLFSEELREIHKNSFPDLKFGQFVLNAINWIQSTKGINPFFLVEDRQLDLFKEYVNSVLNKEEER